MRPVSSIALIALVVAACGGGGEPLPTTIVLGPGAASATEAVEELRQFLIDGDFAAASSLAIPGQAALAALGDGAGFDEVARALEGGDAAIAANFWSGFAQGAGEALTGEVTLADAGTQSQSDLDYHIVTVTPDGGSAGRLVTRDLDGHRVDLFASFGAGLASELLSPYELLLETPSEDGSAILGASQDIVPSLLVAASDPALSPEAVQDIYRLVELITRVG